MRWPVSLNPHRLLQLATVLLAGLAVGWLAVQPSMLRLLLASVAGLLLVAVSVRHPVAVIQGLFLFLPFLGFFRRLLIPLVGWSPADPLLMIAPAITIVLSLWVAASPPAGLKRPLSKGVSLLMALSFLQIFNPLQGELTVGLGGAFLLLVPLCWFYIGHQLAEPTLDRMLDGLLVIAAIASLYGIYQSSFGLLPFEQQWVELGGYTALSVGGVTRAFSTFASSAEYAQYVAIAAAVAVSRALSGRRWCLLLLLIYLPALLLESSRGVMVTLALAIMIIIAARARTPLGAIGALVGSAGTLLVVGSIALSLIARLPMSARIAPLISHQVLGLQNPVNEQHSTAAIHSDMLRQGMLRGVEEPLGRGLGSVTLAASKFKGAGADSEVDLSNAFTALGLPGGLLYAWIIIAVLWRAWRLYRRSGLPTILAILGALLVAIGGWWHGGKYVTVPLIWLLIGAMNSLEVPTHEDRSRHA